MWFEELMDDCKNALRTCYKNKGIFIPTMIQMGLYVFTIIVAVIGFVIWVISNLRFTLMPETYNDGFSRFVPAIIGGLLIYFFLVIINIVVEVGSIRLYDLAEQGIRPKTKYFMEGVKKYFFRVLGLTLGIHGILLILMPIIFVVYIIYMITIGVLTAGWGLTLLVVFIGVYLNIWTIAVVLEDMRAIKAVTTSIRFGHQYFWSMFVLTLSLILLSAYVTYAFGTLIALLAGWFILAVITTYFKVVFVVFYKRKRNEFYALQEVK